MTSRPKMKLGGKHSDHEDRYIVKAFGLLFFYSSEIYNTKVYGYINSFISILYILYYYIIDYILYKHIISHILLHNIYCI